MFFHFIQILLFFALFQPVFFLLSNAIFTTPSRVYTITANITAATDTAITLKNEQSEKEKEGRGGKDAVKKCTKWKTELQCVEICISSSFGPLMIPSDNGNNNSSWNVELRYKSAPTML